MSVAKEELPTAAADAAKCQKLSVSYVPTSELRPHPRNARAHSNKQIKQIVASIKEFGFTNPLLVDRNNTVVAGHGRLEAAKRLSMPEVPILRLSDLSEDQVRAYLILDNKVAANSTWNLDLLSEELQHLLKIENAFDVSLTGFEMAEIDLIIGESTKKLVVEEAEPSAVVEELAVSKPGDLWLLGGHRILCGNALENSAFDQLMQGEKASLVAVDPPYNVPIDGHVGGLGKTHHADFAMACGEMGVGEFTEFLTKATRLLAAHSKDGSLAFFFKIGDTSAKSWPLAMQRISSSSMSASGSRTMAGSARSTGVSTSWFLFSKKANCPTATTSCSANTAATARMSGPTRELTSSRGVARTGSTRACIRRRKICR